MTSRSLDVRLATITFGAAMVILMTTLSCDSTGPLPEPPTEVPAAPKAPNAPEEPATPDVPEVPTWPMEPVMPGQILFVDPWVGAIYVADSTGPRAFRVLSAGPATDLTVSADGGKVAFSRPCKGWCSEIFIMTVGEKQQLLLHVDDTSDQSAHPALSPDGRRIAFVQNGISSDGSHSWHIYTVNADGTDITQLTFSGGNVSPDWSPDGTRILFVGVGGVSEMDPDGSNVRLLWSGNAEKPTWSPDGSHIAFVRSKDDVRTLFVMNADGSNATALTSGLDWNGHIAWAPDGKSIAFVVTSAARMCDDWTSDYSLYPCGYSVKRVSLDGVIDPVWEIASAYDLAWLR